MKITKEELRKIIKEELNGMLQEDPSLDHMTVENFVMVLQQLSPLIATGTLAALAVEPISKAVEKVKDVLNKRSPKDSPMGSPMDTPEEM